MANSVLAFILGAVAVLMLPAAGVAYRTGVLPLPAALLQGMRWAAYLGVAAVVVSTIALVLAYRRRLRPGIALAAAGLVLGALAVGIPLRWQSTARSVPPIHDITTDTVDPPTFERVVALRAGRAQHARLRRQRRTTAAASLSIDILADADGSRLHPHGQIA